MDGRGRETRLLWVVRGCVCGVDSASSVPVLMVVFVLMVATSFPLPLRRVARFDVDVGIAVAVDSAIDADADVSPMDETEPDKSVGGVMVRGGVAVSKAEAPAAVPVPVKVDGATADEAESSCCCCCCCLASCSRSLAALTRALERVPPLPPVLSLLLLLLLLLVDILLVVACSTATVVGVEGEEAIVVKLDEARSASAPSVLCACASARRVSILPASSPVGCLLTVRLVVLINQCLMSCLYQDTQKDQMS
jgi:hypothetical protein